MSIQLLMRFFMVVALLVAFVVIAARAAKDCDLLRRGMAILAGVVRVPHGWGSDSFDGA